MVAVILDGGKPKYDYLPQEEAQKVAAYFIGNLISALDNSGKVTKIILVTKSAIDLKSPKLKICGTTADASLVANINKSLTYVNSKDGKVLFCTSDIPLVNTELIDIFIEDATALNADIVYPIIPKEAVVEFSNAMKRTFINLRDGSFTGGNVFLVSTDGIKKAIPNVEYIYSIRKNPKKMVKTLGILLIVKLLFRRLTIKRLEEKCSQIFGVTCKALTTRHAEIGIDVDKNSDYEFVTTMLR